MSEPKGTADEIKAAVLEVAQESLRTGLVHGTAGNFSARLPDGNVVMTPSSLAYETMTLDDLVVVDLEGNTVEGSRSPTTEKMLHLACLAAYDDIHAVIHCHAKFATMFALVREPVPCVIEEVEVFVGGDVPVAEYRFTGSQELADAVLSGEQRPDARVEIGDRRESLHGLRREIAIRRHQSARVFHLAVAGLALGDRHTPASRSCRDQARACLGASLAHR